MTNIKKVNFKKATITIDEEIQFAGDKKDSENDGRLNAESIVDKIVTFDYYEDVLSPAITAYIRVSDTTNILSRLPIRGYERVDLTFGTGNGDLTFGDNEKFSNPLYAVSYTHLTLPTIYSV